MDEHGSRQRGEARQIEDLPVEPETADEVRGGRASDGGGAGKVDAARKDPYKN